MKRNEKQSRASLKEKERKCRQLASATKDVRLRTFYMNAAQGFAIRAASIIPIR